MTQQLQDLPYILALADLPQIGPVKQVQLLKRYCSAQKIFSLGANELLDSRLLKPQQVAAILSCKDFALYKDRCQRLNGMGIQVLDFRESNYPRKLLEIASYPTVLFAKGNLELLNQNVSLAVVGTRRMTDYGRKVVGDLIPKFTEHKMAIVSGLAFGIDAEAHWQCLKHQGFAIGVQAQGVDKGYPRGNQNLYDAILNQKGLIISEYPFLKSNQVDKFHFPRRNRLVSGLSDGVLVVEANQRSGSLITARYALDQNRPVFAVPGGLYQKYSQGCLDLLNQGAHLVTSAQGLLEDLGVCSQKEVDVEGSEEPMLFQSHRVPSDLFETSLEREIHKMCQPEAQSLDDLMDQASEGPSYVSATITKMQLAGRLKEVAGKRFLAE